MKSKSLSSNTALFRCAVALALAVSLSLAGCAAPSSIGAGVTVDPATGRIDGGNIQMDFPLAAPAKGGLAK